MKLTTLIEDTLIEDTLIKEHGLSLYIETAGHRLLFDTGADGAFASNARVLGVDLAAVDTAVISHGHYDHGGGLKTFLGCNDRARIYIRSSAFGSYWHIEPGVERYIGLEQDFAEQQVHRFFSVDGNHIIDSELSILTGFKGRRGFASTNRLLKLHTPTGYVEDNFDHEQALIVNEGGRRYLISGCAHNGILNILDEYRNINGGYPDVVISGMHLSRKAYSEDALAQIDELANALMDINSNAGTVFYTCHCTGRVPYERMKAIMGDTLGVLRTGTRITP